MAILDRLPIIGRFTQRSRAFKHILRALRLFVPMIKDVISGRYRPIPWSAIGWMVAAFAYMVSPIDLVPDFLILFGVIDDVVIVSWLLTRVDRSLVDYRAWRGEPEVRSEDDIRDI